MKSRSVLFRRISLPVALVVLLACIGCDDVYLSNPLDSIREDRIVGRWADDKGKLTLIIERGPGDSYNSWAAEDYYAHKGPGQIYVAAAGGLLFTESAVSCEGHKFQTPTHEESPRGCWSLTRVVVSDTTLDYNQLDGMAIVRQSVAGKIPIEHTYGVTTGKDGKGGSAEVLLKGTPQALRLFLSSFATGAIYSNSTRFHRL